jgi:hypothetical protein
MLGPDQCAIRDLIENRWRDLNLTRTDLVRNAGYKNVVKGLRRLQTLMTGDLETTKGLIAKLPEALELRPEDITEAVEETRRQIREKEEQAYRASFKPHAIVLTERKIPTQTAIALLVGAPRLLRIDFDLKQRPNQLHSSGSQRISSEAAQLGWRSRAVFGRPVGLVVNYVPERAVRHDLEGKAVEVLGTVHRPMRECGSIRRHRYRVFLRNGLALRCAVPQLLQFDQHGESPFQFAIQMNFVASEALQFVRIKCFAKCLVAD